MANSDKGNASNGDESPGPSSATGSGDGQQPATGAPPPTGGTGEPTTSAGKRPDNTHMAGTWAAVGVAIVVLIVLLIFILQNLQSATVTFLWINANLPVGVALLLAAAIGGLLVLLVGAARILQQRRSTNRDRRKSSAGTAAKS